MHINLVTDKQKKTDQQNFRTDKRGTFYGVTVKMHSPKLYSPVIIYQEIRTSQYSFPRKLLLLGVYIY